MNFIKNILSTLIALFAFSIVAFLFLLLFVAIISAEEPVNVKNNSVLHIKLNRPISEIEYENPLDNIGLFHTLPSTIGVIQLKEAIINAKEDEKIKGIYLDVPYIMAGLGAIEDIREALIEFKESGKFVIAYGEFFMEKSYYLVSVADAVYLHPHGEVELNGMGANLTFFKGLLDKLEIEPQIFRVGDFKSAVEPFIRTDMSDENRLQFNELITSLNTTIVNNVAESRGIAPEELDKISSGMLVRSSEDATKYGIVDSLIYYDQVLEVLKNKVGIKASKEVSFISYEKYKKSFSSYKSGDNEVAVIVASGDIVSGKGDYNTIGSEKYAKEIRKAREDEDVKAIVLRINSPGGSFHASDVMWREIMLAAKEKTVIASMSDLAASGGYYMAMACDTIVAHPTTITGSIGIFGMIFNVQGFLNSKLGITHDEVKTGEFSTMYTMTRPLTLQEKTIIQNGTNRGYDTFIKKAAEGRNMDEEEIKKIASGRVWSGTQALENGLVDKLGGFDEALNIAIEAAGIQDDYKVRFYPKAQNIFDEIFGNLEGQTNIKVLQQELGELYPYVEDARKLLQMEGIQARTPFEIEIN